MRKLVAALIAREENALVLREIAERADGLLRRMRQRHRIATARGHDIDIGDTGAVAGEDQLAVIGRPGQAADRVRVHPLLDRVASRSEEHTSELQSLMRISYAVFCLKKKYKATHAHGHFTIY